MPRPKWSQAIRPMSGAGRTTRVSFDSKDQAPHRIRSNSLPPLARIRSLTATTSLMEWCFFRTALVSTIRSVGSRLRDLTYEIATMESSGTAYMIPQFDEIGFTTLAKAQFLGMGAGTLRLIVTGSTIVEGGMVSTQTVGITPSRTISFTRTMVMAFN